MEKFYFEKKSMTFFLKKKCFRKKKSPKFPTKNIFEKIQVDNRTQAVAFYNQLQKEKL